MRDSAARDFKACGPLPAGPVRCKCPHCAYLNTLDPAHSRLYFLGLLPLRCGDCERMVATARYPALVRAIRGWS